MILMMKGMGDLMGYATVEIEKEVTVELDNETVALKKEITIEVKLQCYECGNAWM